ncbi:MlaD family protein [Patulibacter brassicae]|jgi:virulence factor Mce-like protein|uniref:MlaD family protein n=1 Tax=Patulibacter brassicae TaxID=1705717 RepID=A0ABU4VMN3_9ACTN|nr:MlaD family protein [Patulibacter brassicae]MDX8153101.1 MlaD family protein [Patulibacter brassicae]
MSTRSPGVGRILLMIGFALSCFALLLFLWLAFGGPAPLRPQGYRVHVSFAEGAQLASEADVRISGVPVGKVKSIEANRRTGRADAVVEVQPRFAPLPRNTRAVLRAKTLLGETYVELTPGNRRGPAIADGGRLPDGRVAETVEFDEVLRTFDRPTREALREQLQRSALALDGRGTDLSAAIGLFSPFAQDGATLLRILDAQRGDLRTLVRDGGRTVGALSERRGQLAGLITDAGRALAITDRRGASLRAGVAALPAFQREAQRSVARLRRFSDASAPLVAQLRPAARELSPSLRSLEQLAPDLRALFVDLGPLITRSRTGLPALTEVTDALRPALADIGPLLREVNPALEFVGRYPQEGRAFFANAGMALNGSALGVDGKRYGYLRLVTPLNLENLAIWKRRLATNRPNAYAKPGAFSQLAQGMPVFENRQCGAPRPSAGVLSDLLETLGASLTALAPGCAKQGPFTNPDGSTGDYPRVARDPE